MAINVVRKKILKIETALLEQGRLKCKGDIFFLRWGEIKRLMSGELDSSKVKDCIGERQREHIRLSKMGPPRTINIDVPPEPASSSDDLALRGQSASPGICEGRARVIHDPAVNSQLEKGEILVAPFTDPAWTPLFLVAGAAVVEIGSYLSHAGTVAREFGLPCVVDVSGATTRIRTGDRLRVDGDRGLVILLKDMESGV